jgi:hypothetical protein
VRANCARSGPRPRSVSRNTHKKRVKDNALHLKQPDPYIGGLELKQMYMGSLQDLIAKRRKHGVKTNAGQLDATGISHTKKSVARPERAACVEPMKF